MIRAAVRARLLAVRLAARAQDIAARRVATRSRSQRSDWRSAAALWPDLFGDPGDGK